MFLSFPAWQAVWEPVDLQLVGVPPPGTTLSLRGVLPEVDGIEFPTAVSSSLDDTPLQLPAGIADGARFVGVAVFDSNPARLPGAIYRQHTAIHLIQTQTNSHPRIDLSMALPGSEP